MNYTENESYFHHLGHDYGLNRIFRVAGLLPVSQVKAESLDWLLTEVEIDPARVEQADISIPIIVMTSEPMVVVDGLHRLAKLKQAGITQVNAIAMKPEWFVDGEFLANSPHGWFLTGCKHRRHYFKEWLLRMFAVTELPTQYSAPPVKDEQYLESQPDAATLNNRQYWPVIRNGIIGYESPTGRFVECVGLKPNQAIVAVNDTIAVEANAVPNLDRNVITTVGNVLFNYLTLVYAFGKKVPFKLGKVKLSAIEDEVVKRLVDDVDDPNQENPDLIYVRELKRWIKAATGLGGLSTICVPAATPRTLLPHPEAAALRRKLVEQYAGQLHDPAKVAIIAAELERLDREWCASDPDAGFYQADKSFAVIRMKMFGIFGAEQNFRQGGYTFIERPLEEGWDLAQLPAMIDSLRDGSYNRGAETALGGYEVKTILRTMSGSVISEDDCGATVGLTTLVDAKTKNELIGHTAILENGQQVKLTAENVSEYIGKTIQLRDPGFCLTSNNNFCLTCFGDFIADKKQALGVVASELGSRLLLLFMKRMHGSALKTVKYEHKLRIS